MVLGSVKGWLCPGAQGGGVVAAVCGGGWWRSSLVGWGRCDCISWPTRRSWFPRSRHGPFPGPCAKTYPAFAGVCPGLGRQRPRRRIPRFLRRPRPPPGRVVRCRRYLGYGQVLRSVVGVAHESRQTVSAFLARPDRLFGGTDHVVGAPARGLVAQPTTRRVYRSMTSAV